MVQTGLSSSRRFIFCTLSCWFASMLCTPGIAQNSSSGSQITRIDTIPCEYDPLTCPSPVIQVSVNGSKPLRFILDTGCGEGCILFKQTAQQLGIAEQGSVEYIKPGHNKLIRVPIKTLGLLRQDGSVAVEYHQPLAAYIIDTTVVDKYLSANGIAGVIGCPALAECALRFDFVAKKITVSSGSLTPSDKQGWTCLPLSFAEEKACYEVAITLGTRSTAPVTVDTGCYFDVSLPSKYLSGVTYLWKRDLAVGYMGGKTRGVEYLLPQVNLQDLQEPNVTVCTDKFQTGLLGMSLLSRFEVVLDFPKRELWLRRASNYADIIRRTGLSQVVLGAVGDQWVVSQVVPSSPADGGGVRRGDLLLKIDGRDVHELTLPQAQRLLDGFEGTQARLTLKRNDQSIIEVTYTR